MSVEGQTSNEKAVRVFKDVDIRYYTMRFNKHATSLTMLEGRRLSEKAS